MSINRYSALHVMDFLDYEEDFDFSKSIKHLKSLKRGQSTLFGMEK